MLSGFSFQEIIPSWWPQAPVTAEPSVTQLRIHRPSLTLRYLTPVALEGTAGKVDCSSLTPHCSGGLAQGTVKHKVAFFALACRTCAMPRVNDTPDCLVEFFPQSKTLMKSIDCIFISRGSAEPTHRIVCLLTERWLLQQRRVISQTCAPAWALASDVEGKGRSHSEDLLDKEIDSCQFNVPTLGNCGGCCYCDKSLSVWNVSISHHRLPINYTLSSM